MLLHYGLVFLLCWSYVCLVCWAPAMSTSEAEKGATRQRRAQYNRAILPEVTRWDTQLDRWIDIGSTLDRHWIDMNKTKLVSGLARKRIQWKLISYVSCSLSDENRNVNGMYLVLGFFLRMESWSLERKSAWKNSESAVCLRAPLFWAWNLMHPKAKKQNSHATPKGTAPQSKVNLKKQMENQFC